LLGEPTARGPVRRAGARPGDAILVTGPLGGSLFAGRHLRPEPRVAEAQLLHSQAALHALIDISDGLSSDLAHILAESGGLGAVLEAGAIPIHADAQAMSARDGVPALEHALHDGEDFELCAVAAPADADRLLAVTGANGTLFRVGTITRRPGLRLRTAEGTICPMEAKGFDHFRERS
jgi:thiamine-monophosphate kinase